MSFGLSSESVNAFLSQIISRQIISQASPYLYRRLQSLAYEFAKISAVWEFKTSLYAEIMGVSSKLRNTDKKERRIFKV